jgi:molybdenum cofactor guanylyltransferase
VKPPPGEPAAPSFTALLLAGGLSKRMGRDKAGLVVQGEPLWARQLALLRTSGFQAVWVSARSVPAWAHEVAETLLDVPPSRGPLSGIALALERINTTHLAVLAIDMPDMPSAHLRKIARLAQPARGVLPVTSEHFEPLAAIYPKQAATIARARLESGHLVMHDFAAQLLELRLLEEYRLNENEKAFYRNLNTPKDVGHGRIEHSTASQRARTGAGDH